MPQGNQRANNRRNSGRRASNPRGGYQGQSRNSAIEVEMPRKDGRIDIVAFLNKANELAKKVAETQTKYTQLRNFYDEWLKIKEMLSANRGDSEGLWERDGRVMLCMLKARAEYAAHRENPPLKGDTKKVIEKLVDESETLQDFLDLTVCFEGFMGYFRCHAKYK